MAGTIRDNRPYQLYTSISDWLEILCGDFDINGEITIKDLITIQLFQVNEKFTKKFLINKIIQVNPKVFGLEEDLYYDDFNDHLEADAFDWAQLLTLYLSEKNIFSRIYDFRCQIHD